jgi:hypothetical protein
MKAMKNMLLMLLLMVVASAGYAQQFRMVANPSGFPTPINDSTYQVSVLFAADQTGNGFLPTQIPGDGSYRIFYQNEAIFKITGISNQTFASADLTIVYLGGSSTSPVGQALVYDPGSSAGIPQAPANGNGSSPVLNAAIATYNAGQSSAGDGSNTDELQQLSRSGVEVTLSGGGGIISVEDGDADPANEIQDLTPLETGIATNADSITALRTDVTALENKPDLVDDADNDPTNEIQDLTPLENGIATNADSITALRTDVTALENKPDLVDDADNDPTNEIQDLTPLENGIATNADSIIALRTDVTALENKPDLVDDADNDPTNEIQDLTPLENGIATNADSITALRSDLDAKTWLKQELEAGTNISILGNSTVTYELDNLGQYTLRVFDGSTASRLLMTPSLTSLVNGSSSNLRLESDGAKLRYGNFGAINSVEAKASGIEINTPNVSSAIAQAGQVLTLQADGSVEYEDALAIPDLTAAPLTSVATNAATYGFAQAYTDGTSIRLGRTIVNTTLHQFYVDAAGNILENGTHTITASFPYSVGTVYYVQDDGSLASTADNDGDATDYDSAAVYVLQDNGDGTYVVQLKEPRHFIN